MQNIKSLQHPLVKHMVKLRDDKSYRLECQTALISGTKLIFELGVKHPLKTLVVIEGISIPEQIRAETVFFVTEEIMKKITLLQTPEPFAAEIPLPSSIPFPKGADLLVLDQISDPGNLGNLLRTALALGWEGVFLVKGTVDPFNDKALRAARGATFYLNIQTGSYQELLELIDLHGLSVVIGDPQGSVLGKYEPKHPIALVLGNEAHGPNLSLKARGEKVAIPIDEKMESLNVSSAGAILLFQLKGKKS
ncbi:MAG: RNA methyltransferase [Chlamydiales bacterium]|nr:RNA methyltransferase [Chlamydiales bacterium]